KQLVQSFQHIANVRFSIQVKDQQVSEKNLQDYWNDCLQQIDGISPLLLSLLQKQLPSIKGNKLMLKARNDTEARTLKEKYGEIISQIYQSYGFPAFIIEATVVEQTASNDYAKFIEAKKQEDEAHAKQAVQEMQKRAMEKEQGKV